jgi:hypothetical protein
VDQNWSTPDFFQSIAMQNFKNDWGGYFQSFMTTGGFTKMSLILYDIVFAFVL